MKLIKVMGPEALPIGDRNMGSRRAFLSSLLGLSLIFGTSAAAEDGGDGNPVRRNVMTELAPLTARIDVIEAYAVPVKAERRFSYEVQKERLHLFIRIAAAGQSGWAEMNLGQGTPETTLEQRASRLKWYSEMKGMTPGDAIEKPQENDVFQRSVTRNPVSRTPDGRFGVARKLPGFGVEIDLEKLQSMSSGRIGL